MFMNALRRACLFLLVAAPPTNGAISVGWAATGGFVPDAAHETVGILTMPQNPTGQGLAQLVFTPSGTIARALKSAHAEFVSGDNTVLASVVLEVGRPETFTEFADFSVPTVYYNPLFTPGFVFVRVFERNLPAIMRNTRYYDGPLLALQNISSPIFAPQFIDANRHELAGGIGDALFTFDPLTMSVGVIPEPTSLGLMLLGLVAGALGSKRAA